MDVASFLRMLAEKLRRTQILAIELEALQIEAAGRDISVHARKAPLTSPYPHLEHILAEIGDDCLRRRVEIAQLKRISFGQREVAVELAGPPPGETAAILHYRIEAVVVRAPAEPAYSAAAG
jgi:hypothetical protein